MGYCTWALDVAGCMFAWVVFCLLGWHWPPWVVFFFFGGGGGGGQHMPSPVSPPVNAEMLKSLCQVSPQVSSPVTLPAPNQTARVSKCGKVPFLVELFGLAKLSFHGILGV